MRESAFQSKIIKKIESIGGEAINGRYTKAGIADLICGYPVVIGDRELLLHIHIEVKTKADWYRVMQSVEELNISLTDKPMYRYFIKNKKYLKSHETLQITKLNEVREKNGLAIVAYEFEQVEEYIKRWINDKS